MVKEVSAKIRAQRTVKAATKLMKHVAPRVQPRMAHWRLPVKNNRFFTKTVKGPPIWGSKTGTEWLGVKATAEMLAAASVKYNLKMKEDSIRRLFTRQRNDWTKQLRLELDKTARPVCKGCGTKGGDGIWSIRPVLDMEIEEVLCVVIPKIEIFCPLCSQVSFTEPLVVMLQTELLGLPHGKSYKQLMQSGDGSISELIANFRRGNKDEGGSTKTEALQIAINCSIAMATSLQLSGEDNEDLEVKLQRRFNIPEALNPN